MDFGISQLPLSSVLVIVTFVSGYFLMVTFFGTYFSKFSSNINDFFFSGQRFAWWLPLISMMATGIGSYSYLKYSQQGLNTGLSSTMGYMNDWFIIPLFLLTWLPIIYFSRIKSVPEYFEKRFNSTCRYIAVFILLGYIFYYIGYNLFTIGIAFQGIFGIPPYLSVPFITLILGLYVTLGGQTAVIFTDVVQGILLYFIGFLIFGYGLYALGGLHEFWSYLPVEHKLPFAPLRVNPHFNSVGMFWGDAMAGSIAFLFLNQGFLMRFLSVRSYKESCMAGLGNIIITLPLSAIVVGSVGWIGKSILEKQKAIGGALPGFDLLQINDGFQTFVTVTTNLIQGNAIVLGLVLSALIAALMSTVDTLINAASAIGVYDIYKPLVRPKASAKHYLKVARGFSIFSAGIALLLVIWFFKQKGTLMSIHYKGIMMIIPSILTTLLMGILWKRFSGKAACAALICGASITFMTLFFPEWILPLRSFAFGSQTGDPFLFRALFGILVTMIVGIIANLFTDPPDEQHTKGYTIDTIDDAMVSFKGGEPNLAFGKTVKNLKLIVDDSIADGLISLSESVTQKTRSKEQDIVYLADQRWYLGGLRSGHFRKGTPHNKASDIVLLSQKTLKDSYLLKDNLVFVKKII